MAPRPSFILVLDFDGTVTNTDIGDEVCDRFAPPAWRDIDQQWVRNELTLPEAQRRMWALARAERPDAVAFARSVAARRPGLEALLSAVERLGGEAWLASGGFDFYIEPILDGTLRRFSRAWFNRTRFADGKIELEFPHQQLACDRCAVCKGRVCDLARVQGARVIFAGDGASDRCAIGRADVLCAVTGSLLARACDERKVDYVSFEDFDDVVEAL